ncbi:alkaline phosphatase D family protein [Pseudonocardia parietis]|uniref:Alkaline phosphatase D n=1 Tax=Pseudonocardia parietis TaxID=570936 RepID=A0ABS4VYC3_9PSEU|nr:alkaline phosphatase D family protein [Pseudonocardia parietis]MBP2368914.1 alkaline phosphatase D [Pseudonocardia parietis]
MPALPRRTVLLGTLAGALSGALPYPEPANPSRRAPRQPSLPDPFTLGVASGDPSPDGVVLWTRLAPRPDAEDGLGGMPDRPVDVEWEIAEDEAFTRVVRRGTETTTADVAHSVHAEPAGLAPDREYFYRFRTAGHLSPAARTRTAPAPGAPVAALTVAAASCAKFGAGYFTAYRALADDAPDLVLHLGDYFYESDEGEVRDPGGPEPTDLTGYRRRHAHQRSDADLRAAHAVAPWLVVWDDHELVNNWAGGDRGRSPDRRRAAFQAYYEHMPLRRASVPRGLDLQLFRRVAWGSLATFHMLDTRQYRAPRGSGGSITGLDQERWLLNGFRTSGASWDVLGQQVFFAPRSGDGHKSDTWESYAGSRERVMAGWLDSPVRNAVVLTGDEHVHHANELTLDDRPAGTELVTTSVTSGGDGGDGDGDGGDENPHIRYREDRRGYLLTRFTPTELRADFRVVEQVSEPGAPVRTSASFVVPDGGALTRA